MTLSCFRFIMVTTQKGIFRVLFPLQISIFNNEEQGQSGPGFAWVVFSGEKDGSFEAKSSFSPNFTFTDSDKEKVIG